MKQKKKTTKTKMSEDRAVLAVMAKNEGHIIDRAVESAANHVAGAFLLDTGSTDDTISGFQETCDHYGLDCRVEQVEFSDFGRTRSQLLERAEVFASEIGATWVLQLDADETLETFVGGIDSILAEASPGVAISLEHRSSSSPANWWCPKLTPVGLGFRYEGVIHEALFCMTAPAPWSSVTGAVVHAFFDSWRNLYPVAKYQQDLALLLSAPVIHHGHRGLHLGQTYEALAARLSPAEEAAHLALAHEAYVQALAHLDEDSSRGERYWCLLRAGCVLERLKPGSGLETLLEAQRLWPERVEATAYLAEAYRVGGATKLAHQHLQIAWENLCDSPELTGERVDLAAYHQVAERAQLEFALGSHAFARIPW